LHRGQSSIVYHGPRLVKRQVSDTLSFHESTNMSAEVAEVQLQVRFITKQEQYAVPDSPYAIQSNVQVADLNTLINALILSGCYDNSIHIWSTKGQHKLAIPGHTSPVKAVSWVSLDADQAVFVSGSHDQSAMLWVWNVPRNSVDCVVTCRGHEKGIECLAVSADASRFATGSWDNNVNLWSTSLAEEENVPAKKKSKPEHGKAREPLTTLKGHREAVSGVQWMDYNTVLSSGWDHLLKLWDCELGGIKQEIAGNKAFFDADWSPLNNSIITASADRHIRLYDPRSTESIVKTTFTSHTGWVQSVRWSKTRDTLFLSAGYDGQVKLWETRSPRTPLYDLSGHEDKVLCCDWSNPSLLVSGSCDNTLRIFKAKHYQTA
ncbi:hypothetical protein HW555_004450, partial [Spodoptera exigua]